MPPKKVFALTFNYGQKQYKECEKAKDLCRELLNETISKLEQSSDWGGKLSKDKKEYAASDVLHLHKLKKKLDTMQPQYRQKKLLVK